MNPQDLALRSFLSQNNVTPNNVPDPNQHGLLVLAAIKQRDAQLADQQNQLVQQQAIQQATQSLGGQPAGNGQKGFSVGASNNPDPMPKNLAGKTQNAILSQAGPITETYGEIQPGVEVFSGGFTSGTGIGVPTGTEVSLPPGKWQVVSSYAGGKGSGIGTNINSGWGNSILAKNAQTGEMLRLSHLSQNYVGQGDTVNGGEIIGKTGDVGNTTGPHLNIQYINGNGQVGDFLKSPYAAYMPISQ